MILSRKNILKILQSLEVEVIKEEGGYIFAKRTRGYSADAEVGPLQAKLSIMLEMASKLEEEGG